VKIGRTQSTCVKPWEEDPPKGTTQRYDLTRPLAGPAGLCRGLKSRYRTTSKSCYRHAVSPHARDVAQFRTRGCRRRFSASRCRTRRTSRSTSYTTLLPSGLVSMPKIRCEPSCFTKRR
jgi:hypothetical protein